MSIVFTLSGVLGSGESGVVNLISRLLDDLRLAVCYTTRTPHAVADRASRFYFTSRHEFERMIAGDEFLEYAEIWGNYYGTRRQCVAQARECGKDLLIQIDELGVEQVRQNLPEAVSILVSPRSAPVTESVIDRRLRSVAQETSRRSHDWYEHAITSDSPEDAATKVVEIIRAERHRRDR